MAAAVTDEEVWGARPRRPVAYQAEGDFVSASSRPTGRDDASTWPFGSFSVTEMSTIAKTRRENEEMGELGAIDA